MCVRIRQLVLWEPHRSCSILYEDNSIHMLATYRGTPLAGLLVQSFLLVRGGFVSVRVSVHVFSLAHLRGGSKSYLRHLHVDFFVGDEAAYLVFQVCVVIKQVEKELVFRVPLLR